MMSLIMYLLAKYSNVKVKFAKDIDKTYTHNKQTNKHTQRRCPTLISHRNNSKNMKDMEKCF